MYFDSMVNQVGSELFMKVLLFFLLACVSEVASAQSNSRLTITRGAVAGGGTTFSTSNRFQLGSTIAQPLGAVSSSSRFSVQAGFWIWPAPSISAPRKVGGSYTISFHTELGKTYTVRYLDSVSATNWLSLPTITGDGTVKTVTLSAVGAPQRFYQLIEQ